MYAASLHPPQCLDPYFLRVLAYNGASWITSLLPLLQVH